ncbi:hypothetical protein [Nonomuraea sp. SBT364]|uniref:hypothetical protein n=1 Tax=Nonomuraea sp. SBT364 TaxID=1580530 RepID=UPI00066A9F33|nr:hypothetical protein [Nonomuraea sp. SBT364]
MVRGRHRRPARGGIRLTTEQLAALALVSALAATCSTITGMVGAVTGDPPAVVAGPTVTVTAPAPGRTLGPGYDIIVLDCAGESPDAWLTPDPHVRDPGDCRQSVLELPSNTDLTGEVLRTLASAGRSAA